MPPTWNDPRNPDWERATLRHCPPVAVWPEPRRAFAWLRWPDARAARRIDIYVFGLALLALPILLYTLYTRL